MADLADNDNRDESYMAGSESGKRPISGETQELIVEKRYPEKKVIECGRLNPSSIYNNSNISQDYDATPGVGGRDVEGKTVVKNNHLDNISSLGVEEYKSISPDSSFGDQIVKKPCLLPNDVKSLKSDMELDLDQDRKMFGCSSSSLRAGDSLIDNEREKSRLSDLSISSGDYDDDDNSIEAIRQMQFLLSSSISTISDDDQDLASRLELTENLSDQSVLSSDDTEFYNDWDPGLGNSANDNVPGNHTPEIYDSDSEFERIPVQDLPFPHRAQHLMECEICLKTSYLRRRVCCDFQICNKCLSMYITLKVKDGKVKMECPNDRCDSLVFKDEIHFRLSTAMREKFAKYLIDANADPYVKTCPSCSQPYEIDPKLLNVRKRKLKYGLTVVCSHCKLVWCYLCQAPFHSPLSCKKYKKDDEMVKRWAKEKTDGLHVNAQKCPKCKIFIQKKDGCDHMQCTHCETEFCYRCGDRYMNMELLGNHLSRFSIFGCKYQFLPKNPGLRRLIRGTNFGARLIGLVILAGLGVAAGAVLVGASVFILPGYGILQLRRIRKKKKKFLKVEMLMLEAAKREKELLNCPDILFLDSQGYMSTIPEESETETSNPTSDPQQIQVLVHRSVSFNKDDTEERIKDCDILVNKYINDGSEVFISKAVDGNAIAAEGSKEENVVMATDVQEIQNENGYTTVVCNITSKVNRTDSEMEEKVAVVDCGGSENAPDDAHEVCNVDLASNVDNKADDSAQNQICMKSQPHSLCDTTLPVESHMENNSPNDVDQEKTKKKVSSNVTVNDPDDTPLSSADRKLFRELEEKLKEREDKLKEKEEKLKEKEDKLKEKEDKLRGKEDKLKERGNASLISKSKSNQEKAPVSEVIVDKMANNGCFGNIFSSSKRVSSPIQGNQEVSKIDLKTSKTKDLFNVKAATWEKCRKTNPEVETLSKTSNELTADIKHLPYYLQKSPSSLSSIISFSYGAEEEAKAKGSESLKPVIKADTLTESINKKGSHETHHMDHDASIDSGYVSQCNFVTYL